MTVQDMMDRMDGIKAVFLDIDDTLLDFDACAKESMFQAAENSGISLPEDAETVFHRTNDRLWGRLQNGELSQKELHRIRWGLIFEELGVEGDGEAFDRAFSGGIFETAVPVAGAEALLETLSQRFRLFAASNASLEEQTHRLEKSGMIRYFEKIFVSDRIGFPKPQKEFFDACFRELPDLRPEEVMMIGDSISSDISGAHFYGMRTCWFNKKKRGDIPDYVDIIMESWV